MTNQNRDYRYVTQKFFDKWNDRIVRQIDAIDSRRVSKQVVLQNRISALEKELEIVKASILLVDQKKSRK